MLQRRYAPLERLHAGLCSPCSPATRCCQDEDEYEESGTQDLDEGEGEVSDLFASQRFLEDVRPPPPIVLCMGCAMPGADVWAALRPG